MRHMILVLGFLVMSLAHASEGTLGVVNKADGTATFFDLASGNIRIVNVGYLPHEVAIGRGWAFVSNYGSAHVRSSDIRNRPGNTISAIRLESPLTRKEIPMGTGTCAPHGMAFSADGRWLFATCEGRNEIAAIDLKTLTLDHTLPTNQAGSHLIVVSKDGQRAYVSNFWHGTVSVIDLASRKLLAQIFTGRGSEGLGISDDDKSVFVTRVEDNEVVKVDTNSLQIVSRASTPPGCSPIRVIPSPKSHEEILVNCVGSGKLLTLNSNDLSLVGEISVGRQPIGLVAGRANFVYVANMKDNNISKVNLTTGLVEGVLQTGHAPDGLGFGL